MGHLDIVQFLIEKGADIDKADNEVSAVCATKVWIKTRFSPSQLI